MLMLLSLLRLLPFAIHKIFPYSATITTHGWSNDGLFAASDIATTIAAAAAAATTAWRGSRRLNRYLLRCPPLARRRRR